MKIKKIELEDVIKCGYKPEPHTVSLRDCGDWYAIEIEGRLVSFCCIRKQRNELYIGEVFTAKEFRKNGYMTMLIDYIANSLYPEYSISTHALVASKHCFELCGFKQYAFREFKYGNQYWLRRSGKKC